MERGTWNGKGTVAKRDGNGELGRLFFRVVLQLSLAMTQTAPLVPVNGRVSLDEDGNRDGS